MNPATRKLIIPLDAQQMAHESIPLQAIYVLKRARRSGPGLRPSIHRFARRDAFIELTRGAFNLCIVEPGRLRRQFDLATHLARKIPIKSLAYARDLRQITEVREAIIDDLE